MKDFESVNIITDEAINQDPHPYFDYQRSKCPVAKMPHYGMMMVTGHREMVEIYQKGETFTHCQMVGGRRCPCRSNPRATTLRSR